MQRTCIKIKVKLGYSNEYFVKVGVHHGLVLSPFLFAIIIDLVTEEIKKDPFNEILNANDLLLMSDYIERIRRKFASWKDSF